MLGSACDSPPDSCSKWVGEGWLSDNFKASTRREQAISISAIRRRRSTRLGSSARSRSMVASSRRRLEALQSFPSECL